MYKFFYSQDIIKSKIENFTHKPIFISLIFLAFPIRFNRSLSREEINKFTFLERIVKFRGEQGEGK